MEATIGKFAIILAALRRLLPGRNETPRIPPRGWERRCMHLPDGAVMEVEFPIGMDRLPSAGASSQNEATDRRSTRSGRPARVTPAPERFPRGVPYPPASGVRGSCPLLNDFLARRARG